jgi:hypothetical protein
VISSGFPVQAAAGLEEFAQWGGDRLVGAENQVASSATTQFFRY